MEGFGRVCECQSGFRRVQEGLGGSGRVLESRRVWEGGAGPRRVQAGLVGLSVVYYRDRFLSFDFEGFCYPSYDIKINLKLLNLLS